MTATLLLDGVAITLKRLVELLDLEEEDDYGILRPTPYAFTTAMKLVFEAYELMGESFPPAWPCTDDEGGIILTWKNRKPDRDLILFTPFSRDRQAYIFYDPSEKKAVEYEVSASKLVYWLQWLNG